MENGGFAGRGKEMEFRPGDKWSQTPWRWNPHPKAAGALYAPGAGIVCPYGLTIALAENAVENGARVFLSQRVTDIVVRDGQVRQVVTPELRINTPFVVNAAGLHSDEIARLVGQDDFHIIPRK